MRKEIKLAREQARQLGTAVKVPFYLNGEEIGNLVVNPPSKSSLSDWDILDSSINRLIKDTEVNRDSELIRRLEEIRDRYENQGEPSATGRSKIRS